MSEGEWLEESLRFMERPDHSGPDRSTWETRLLPAWAAEKFNQDDIIILALLKVCGYS